MVRPRRMILRSVCDAIAVVLFVLAALAGLVYLAFVAFVDGVIRHPWATLCGVLIGVLLFGCAAPAHDPRDPEIWRPTTPAAYPLPQ